MQEGHSDNAILYVYGTFYSQSIAKINDMKNQFLEQLDARTLSEVEILQNKTDVIQTEIIFALVLVAVLQLINMFYTRRKILRPAIVVKNQMGEIAEGNLSAQFSLQPDTSEIGMLVSSIHETKRELRKYMQEDMK